MVYTSSPDCGLCERDSELELAAFENVRVVAPRELHNAGNDGGHLIVLTIRHVLTRWDLDLSELAALHIFSYVCRTALERACGAAWWNLQENGNWGLGRPGGPHMHLHVYGRRRDSARQPFGEALVLPKRGAEPGTVPWYSTKQWRSLQDTFGRLDDRTLTEARGLLVSGASHWIAQVAGTLSGEAQD